MHLIWEISHGHTRVWRTRFCVAKLCSVQYQSHGHAWIQHTTFDSTQYHKISNLNNFVKSFHYSSNISQNSTRTNSIFSKHSLTYQVVCRVVAEAVGVVHGVNLELYIWEVDHLHTPSHTQLTPLIEEIQWTCPCPCKHQGKGPSLHGFYRAKIGNKTNIKWTIVLQNCLGTCRSTSKVNLRMFPPQSKRGSVKYTRKLTFWGKSDEINRRCPSSYAVMNIRL